MGDPADWLSRFRGERIGLPDAVVLLRPDADGAPPARVVDPVPAGPSRLLGRWRLVGQDAARRTADYAPDLR